jgi:hypothetical protein
MIITAKNVQVQKTVVPVKTASIVGIVQNKAVNVGFVNSNNQKNKL